MRVMLYLCLLAGLGAASAAADTAAARCDIYPTGSDTAQASLDCTFGQRQGYISITRADGVEHELEPVGDAPGNFRDQNGQAVYRESGLGEDGQIFRFPDISLFVYWAPDQADAADSPTAPFSTDSYDATAVLRCRASDQADASACPAGVMRMEDQQASVTVLDPSGQQFTMNFMKDFATGEPYVNATNRDAVAVMQGEGWVVTIDGMQVYEVPLVFLTGD